MRAFKPVIRTAATVVALSPFVAPLSFLAPVSLLASLSFLAPVSFLAAVGPALAAEAAPADAPMKPVSLTQKQVEGAVAAQKELHDFEAKQPESKSDKPDPKVEAKEAEIVKKNGFASVDDYAAVLTTIGQVMAGIDPDTKAYIGPAGVIKKQIAEIQGDKKMPAKEKKETLDELNAAMKTATSDKPSAGNIDLVTKNYDALAQGMEAE